VNAPHKVPYYLERRNTELDQKMAELQQELRVGQLDPRIELGRMWAPEAQGFSLPAATD
jgi:hypothetical protein